MTSSDSQNSFFDAFLDDYFAECDEHLTAIRQILLTIEAQLNSAQLNSAQLNSAHPNQTGIDRTQFDTLLRSLHSIKGLSGMVNVQLAEQLAHQIESYVRRLQQSRSSLTAAGIDLLIASANLLEQIIICHRTGAVEPEIEAVMIRLEEIGKEGKGEEGGNAGEEEEREEKGELERRRDQGQERVWRFEFMPTTALAERGINVNLVRDRLNSIGTITRAEPQITATGSIVFHFVVATSASAATFANWQADGLTCRPLVPAQEPNEREGDTEIRREAISSPYPPIHPSTHPPIHPSPLPPSGMVRVELSKLDELMRLVGELVISRARLEEQLSGLSTELPMARLRGLQEVNVTLEQQIRQLREGVMRVRLVPIGEMFTRMQFVVRDLVKENQKQIRLNLAGQETEIDKLIVERMMDPLLHLVRNAVSHGIESPQERVAQGKPPEATITLRAATVGEMVVIEVEDDGRGIESDRIAARAQALGLLNPNASLSLDTLDNALLLDTLCASGFSTREQVDRVSGRGVGMAVVKEAVLDLGGLLTLETHLGQGTRFTIQLPLTLAIADALIVSVGDQVFAIPQAALQEVIAVQQQDMTRLENDEILAYRGGVLPILRLSRMFGLPSDVRLQPGSEETALTSHILVMGNGSNQVGVGVDRVLGQREIVVQPLTDPLVKITGIAGATELGNKQTVLILDVTVLIRAAHSQRQRHSNQYRSNQHDANHRNIASLRLAQPGGSE